MAEATTNGLHAAPGKGRVIAAWILQVLAALAFLMAGVSKLAGAPDMVAVFDQVGIGQWFRYLTGLLEVTGAVGLLIPRFTYYAALLLSAVMIGAILSHLTVVSGSPAAAIVLLLITATIAWLRRP